MFHASRFIHWFVLLIAIVLLVVGLSSVRAAPAQGKDAPPAQVSAAQPSASKWMGRQGVAPGQAAQTLLGGAEPGKLTAPQAERPSTYAERPAPRPMEPPAAHAILSPSAMTQIDNGDFEAGPGVGWSEYSANGACVICLTGGAISGSYAAWLGLGGNDETAELMQSAQVPPEAPYLTFYHIVLSDEASCGYDMAYLDINGSNYMTVPLCQETAGGWRVESIDLSGYAGQYVDIQFSAITDSSIESRWVIDNVTFPVCNSLVLGHTGQGSDPTVHSTSGFGCPDGQYIPGETIVMGASPADGHRVRDWNGTLNDGSQSYFNRIIMPPDNHTVIANYEPVTPSQLANGDFEAGPAGWSEFSSHGWALIVDNFGGNQLAPHSGNWGVWLGGDYSEIALLGQSVTVPSGRPFLRFYSHIYSDDFCGWDWAGVYVNNAMVADYPLCTGTASEPYEWQRISIDLSAFAGQTIQLQFDTVTDSSLNSNRFIDDVQFVADPICHPLTLSHTGEGSIPFADPASSSGCPDGYYAPGQGINVYAAPDDGQAVIGWQGTIGDSLTNTDNVVMMPDSAHDVTVHYGEWGYWSMFLPSVLNIPATCFAGPNEQEPNNNRGQANGPLCPGRVYAGLPNDNYDVFYFVTTAPGPIAVRLDGHTGGGVQLGLLSAGFTPIVYDTDPAGGYRIDRPFEAAGLYFVVVHTAELPGTMTPYTLRVDFAGGR